MSELNGSVWEWESAGTGVCGCLQCVCVGDCGETGSRPGCGPTSGRISESSRELLRRSEPGLVALF